MRFLFVLCCFVVVAAVLCSFVFVVVAAHPQKRHNLQADELHEGGRRGS